MVIKTQIMHEEDMTEQEKMDALEQGRETLTSVMGTMLIAVSEIQSLNEIVKSMEAEHTKAMMTTMAEMFQTFELEMMSNLTRVSSKEADLLNRTIMGTIKVKPQVDKEKRAKMH